MIYYLIVLLWETDEQKKLVEDTHENLFSTLSDGNPDPHEPTLPSEGTADRPNVDDQRRPSHLERIIYSATILSFELAYNSMSGAAYTVYLIQVRISISTRSFGNDDFSSLVRDQISIRCPRYSSVRHSQAFP